ncbi:hypothetical protein BaRGS_00027537 [Batillaria attramentaria]|uniref:Uncharacterized protein n=1 Tax=Batillaria attramentaria TaxID=370345 RepID=A0ABD0K3D3_9CAEN
MYTQLACCGIGPITRANLGCLGFTEHQQAEVIDVATWCTHEPANETARLIPTGLPFSPGNNSHQLYIVASTSKSSEHALGV